MSNAGASPDPNAAKKGNKSSASGAGSIAAEAAAVQEQQKTLSDIVSQEGKRIEDFHERLSGFQKDFEAAQQDLRSATKQFQAPEQKNPAEAFGSFAGILAALAGMATKTPLTTSLNSMAKGMDAIAQGNAQAYDRAFKEWQVNSDYAFKRFEAENEAIQSGFALAEKDYNAGIAYLQNVAAITQDKLLSQHLLTGDLQGAQRLAIDRERVGIEAMEAKTKMVPYEIFQRGLQEFVHDNKRQPDAKEMGNLWQQASMATGGGSVEEMARLVGTYQIPIPSGFALKSPFWQAVLSRVSEIYPEFQAARYGEVQKALKDFGTGAQGNMVRSANAAIQHLSLVETLAQALDNGNIQAVNAAKQQWEQQTGSSVPTNFDAAKKIVSDEVVKFIVGGGRGAGALADRQAVEDNLRRAESWDQLAGVIQTYKGLMGGQMKALRRQYETASGLSNFDDLLLPDTLAAMNEGTQQNNSALPQGWSVQKR